MACLIAQRYSQPLTVEEVSRHVGLHPNYAMGLFKRGIGTTIVDYITKHRVSHAQRLLATTDTKIVEVALNSGFASTSRFNAAFRQECGCPPREYRQQHRIAD
jgi:AraC-like DNA-binding protein